MKRRFGIDEEADLFEPDLIDESFSPEDVITVNDFIECLKARCKLNDKVAFRCKKLDASAMVLQDVMSKGGIAVIDLDPADSEDASFDHLSEGHSSYIRDFGGYGGTGRRPSRDTIMRGRDISWFPLSALEPRLRGSSAGYKWRAGPVNYTLSHKDVLYPERVYKPGTTVLRCKNADSGRFAGREVYIAVPSYFDAIVKNDEDAKATIVELGLPLDMTFGMNPRDDYTSTYVIR